MTQTARQRVVLVTGLSGAGKSSILRTLEDIGYEAIDNLPLAMIADVIARQNGALAIGVDARTRGFDSACLLEVLAALRRQEALQPEMVFAWADEPSLLRRYTETRRRHPLAPEGRVADGIAAEEMLTMGLREAADLLVDTSDLPSPMLRRLIEARFGNDHTQGGLTVSLVSFGFPAGLPREADIVLDSRFLRNPHYEPHLRGLTGLVPAVGEYVESDPDFAAFFSKIVGLLDLLLPRFVQEGKKYVTVGVGCTGGRHRSVHIVERLTTCLALAGWRVGRIHRELAGDGARPSVSIPGPRAPAGVEAKMPQHALVQAQEA